jgi:hypothetical protein
MDRERPLVAPEQAPSYARIEVEALPPAEAPALTEERDEGDFSFSEPCETGLPPASAGAPGAIEELVFATEPAAAQKWSEPLPAESEFEVDVGFDPSWQADDEPEAVMVCESEATSTSVEAPESPASCAETITEIPVKRPLDATQMLDLPDEAVLLTEVAGDRDLFEDPSLEVARLAAGDAREIVVPVEIGEGTARRRFKLSVRLRFDPIE